MSAPVLRVLGIDPGLGTTGWGLVEACGSRLTLLGYGVMRTTVADSLPVRLVALFRGLEALMRDQSPTAAAVEETVVNRNPAAALKLAQARSVALLVPALAGLTVGEYAATHIKKSVVGVGNADKDQVRAMVTRLLPGAAKASADAADALAVAITHTHHLQTARRLTKGAA